MTDFHLTEEKEFTLAYPKKTRVIDSKKRYNLISNEIRKNIIEKFGRNHLSLKQLSKDFNIKLSTCKAILHVFQKEGRFEKKKKRIRKSKFLSNSNKLTNQEYQNEYSWLIFPDLTTFLDKFPKLKQLFEDKKPENPLKEEGSLSEKALSDIQTNDSKEKTVSTMENEQNLSFFSDEVYKSDIGVLKTMWEKVFEFYNEEKA